MAKKKVVVDGEKSVCHVIGEVVRGGLRFSWKDLGVS